MRPLNGKCHNFYTHAFYFPVAAVLMVFFDMTSSDYLTVLILLWLELVFHLEGLLIVPEWLQFTQHREQHLVSSSFDLIGFDVQPKIRVSIKCSSM